MFEQFDRNGDNRISSEELGTVMRGLGQNPTEAEVKELIAELDSNGNGTIEFNEFLKMMSTKAKSTEEEAEELRAAFSKFDKDGNGKINVKELQAAMTEIGDTPFSKDEAKAMIKEADIDGDGCINYNEFVKIMTQK
ncbi:hypothetical protein CHS0354_003685 [Potamilus streckersoni]|uniref:EF-hand domain-containing protein n=1 Tax=Potamilus streckersoni TaxID=2493646 RepID=A0AAE0SS09_9BIVA|nr:hypothetical protein CHS0354_003685 [Potamilus streckersoni]